MFVVERDREDQSALRQSKILHLQACYVIKRQKRIYYLVRTKERKMESDCSNLANRSGMILSNVSKDTPIGSSVLLYLRVFTTATTNDDITRVHTQTQLMVSIEQRA